MKTNFSPSAITLTICAVVVVIMIPVLKRLRKKPVSVPIGNQIQRDLFEDFKRNLPPGVAFISRRDANKKATHATYRRGRGWDTAPIHHFAGGMVFLQHHNGDRPFPRRLVSAFADPLNPC